MFVFTSCTNNYVPKARVLASTLKSFHPDWTFCLLLGEPLHNCITLDEEPFDCVTYFDELGIPGYKEWLFRHRVVEICTAAKGPALFHFLTRCGYDKVIYLDPDIMVCSPLSPLDDLLNDNDLLLTPHQLTPQQTQQSIIDNELCAMQYGVFNLGFVAVAARGDGIKFANWWKDRLLHYCYDDIPRGLFTDQRWCDLAPAFFPNLHIVRDPGCNAASWNLTERVITRNNDGKFLANGLPLRFYHFTGFDSGAGDDMTTRYAVNMPAAHELWAIYRTRLEASGHAILGKQPWKYISFNDGTPITDDMRFMYRNREDVRKAFSNPFERPGFFEWYTAERHSKSFFVCKAYRKLRGIQQRASNVLERYGGFPTGLPGLARQSLTWVRKLGIRGVARKIWHNEPYTTFVDNIPELHTALADPTSPIFTLLRPEYTPVFIIEHDWGGGAAHYCEQRVKSLRDQNRAVMRIRYSAKTSRVEMTFCYKDTNFRCILKKLSDLLDNRFPAINSVIVNEIAGWYYRFNDICGTARQVEEAVRVFTELARRHNAHVEFLFHDYFALCPTINLLTPEGKYCGVPQDVGICDTCALRGKPFSIAQWRKNWAELIALTDETVFFSEDTFRRVSSVFTIRDEQIRMRPHVVHPLDGSLYIPVNGPMRVAVVGNIQKHKGAATVLELAALFDVHMPDASIIVFGDIEATDIPDNVIVLGAYTRDTLLELLQTHKVTVSFFPSIWPETFSFVVHELGPLGLPLVCFALGAQGDYVRTLPGSRVVDEISANAAFAALCDLDSIRRSLNA